ncbi:MAG TPA: hypothetical protein VFP11_14410 [Candidatus Angelobacter sp.]|nr:hypothetical protein [Candidatus Angelobacter sp.]
MKKLNCATLIFLLAGGGACVAQSDQPSLGDLAKQQHRQEKKVVKVLTNDDVATVRPDTQTQTTKPGTAAAASSAPETSAKGPEKAKDAEKASSAPQSGPKDTPEVAELKQKLSSYKAEQEGWKRTAKKYEDLLATETSDFRRQMYEEALQGDRQNVEIFQNKIDQTEADLSKAEKASSSGH